jgi:hypothetical protein
MIKDDEALSPSLMLPVLNAETKQKIKRELDRIHKDGLTETEFYDIFEKAHAGTP